MNERNIYSIENVLDNMCMPTSLHWPPQAEYGVVASESERLSTN